MAHPTGVELKDLGVRHDHSEEMAESHEHFPSIYLDREQVEALGLSEDDFGREIYLTAFVEMTHFSSGISDRDDKPSERFKSATLSVKRGALVRDFDEKPAAERLFGSDD